MTTVQPGTVHAFEYAQLYAKVSGYVETLTVDRGSRVKKGELLLSLYVPELVAAVKQAEASLDPRPGGRRPGQGPRDDGPTRRSRPSQAIG